MANRDGTGPEGKGPRTGRGLGNCDDKGDNKSNENAPRGFFGLRRGRGAGAGAGRGGGAGAGRGFGFNRNNN